MRRAEYRIVKAEGVIPDQRVHVVLIERAKIRETERPRLLRVFDATADLMGQCINWLLHLHTIREVKSSTERTAAVIAACRVADPDVPGWLGRIAKGEPPGVAVELQRNGMRFGDQARQE